MRNHRSSIFNLQISQKKEGVSEAPSYLLLVAHARLVGLGRRFDRSRFLEDKAVGVVAKTPENNANENDEEQTTQTSIDIYYPFTHASSTECITWCSINGAICTFRDGITPQKNRMGDNARGTDGEDG